MSKQIKEAKANDVHVVDEGFLDAVKIGGAALLIQSHSICTWGCDVRAISFQILYRQTWRSPYNYN